MPKTRMQKAVLNILSTAILEIITVISGLILPRLVLTNYGSAYNGIISSITQFLSLVSILRLGVAGATRVALYRTLANNDTKGTSSIVKATELYMRKIGVIILVYIICLSVAYPIYLKSEYGYLNIALLVIAVGLGTFAQYFFGITYQTFLTADQSVYIYNTIQSICTIANTAISVMLIIHGYSIQVVKFGSAVVFVLTPFILSIYVSTKYHLDKKAVPDSIALSQKNDVMASSLANIIHQNTDIVVLTLFCDIKLVSVYTVYNLVMTALKKIQDIFTAGVESIFGDMWAKCEYEKISEYLNVFELIIGFFISVVFSCTGILLLPFIGLYTKGVTDIEYILPRYASIICLSQMFFCFRTPYLVLVQGAGKYKETKMGGYIEAALNLGLSILLVNRLGILGTAIGTLVANVFRTVHYSIYIDKKMINHCFGIVIKRILWIMLNFILVTVLFRWVQDYAAVDWLHWMIGAIVSLSVGIIVTFVSGSFFFRDDLRSAFFVMMRVFKRRTNKGVRSK